MVDTIRVGLIGFGLAGRVFHAPLLAGNPAFRLELIATARAERAAEAATRYPDATVVSSPDELLDRAGELDLVVLASPPYAHLEQGLRAFAAGAHVVVDKPFAPNTVEAERLIAAAEEHGRLLAVFQNRRWDGDYLTVRRLLAEERLGRVHRFESSFERWREPAGGRWQDATTIAAGGGVLFDLGSHLIDQALQLFGPAELEHAEVRAVRGAVNDDDATLVLHHDGGVVSQLRVSRVAGIPGPRFRVLGTAAAYTVQGLDKQESALKAELGTAAQEYERTDPDEWGVVGIEHETEFVETEPGDYPAFYAGVAASILNGEPLPVDPRDALEVVRIIQEAHSRSRATG